MKDKKFTVSDLKSGFVVELRDGERLVVARAGGNNFTKILVNPASGWWGYLSNWSDELCCQCRVTGPIGQHRDSARDIMKVYGLIHTTTHYAAAFIPDCVTYRTLLWERREPVKMTLKQIEEKLGHEVQIVSGE
jgi:hypothetical protein